MVMSADNCLFCGIAAGRVPAGSVYQDHDVVAFRDINPQAPSHILVIPRRHIARLADAGDSDGAVLARLLLVAAKVAAAEGLAESGYRIVINSGPDAGESVPHLHVHIIGGRSMAWPPG